MEKERPVGGTRRNRTHPGHRERNPLLTGKLMSANQVDLFLETQNQGAEGVVVRGRQTPTLLLK